MSLPTPRARIALATLAASALSMLVCNAVATAQDASARRPPPPPELGVEALYETGQEHLFNLDYGRAVAAFEEALERAPDHPGPYAWKATALWMREMFRRGEFDLEGYLDVSRFRGDEEEDGGDGRRRVEALTAEIEELVEKGRERARAWAESTSRRRPWGRYYRGLIRGIWAGYRVLVLHEFLSAVGDAKGAVGEHRELLEAYAGWADPAYMVGTFDYVVGKLPWYVKLLAVFVGIRGDAEAGLAHIQRAAREGGRLADSAKVSLTVVYAREQRPERAASLLADLARRYPRNYLFPFNRAVALGIAGRWEEAAGILAEVTAAMDAGEPNYDDATPHRVLLEWSHAASQAGLADDARRAARRVLGADVPDWARTLALLEEGRALDLAGRRGAARRRYRRVLERRDVRDAHDRAERYLESPFRPPGGDPRGTGTREPSPGPGATR